MTTALAKFVSKRFLGETAKNHFGTEDPYFEHVPATRLNGRRGKASKRTTKRRKALPNGISEHDGKVLTKVKRRAYRLDMSLFNFCGIQFGWSSVVGLVPGFGDVFDLFMALMVLRTCTKVEGGLPAAVKLQMMFNIALDFVVGLVPFLGDVADAAFKANTRNAVVLEKFLREVGKRNLEKQSRPIPALDPSSAEVFDRDSDEDTAPPPTYATTDPHAPAQPARPEAARAQPESRGGLSGWLFSRPAGPPPASDVEMADDHDGRRTGRNGPAAATRASTRTQTLPPVAGNGRA